MKDISEYIVHTILNNINNVNITESEIQVLTNLVLRILVTKGLRID